MDTFTLNHIAHELRTPLTLIQSTLQLIERQLPQAKELRYWSQLYEDLQDMNDLVNSLTSAQSGLTNCIVSRSSPSILTAVPVDASTDAATDITADMATVPNPCPETNLYHMLLTLQESFLQSSLGQNVDISLTVDPEAQAIASHFHCQRTPMKEALTNLIKNALEATLEQSLRKLEISITLCQKNSIKAIPKDKLCICIKDNGPGIPASILPHLYTPYVSGKSDGTGIGLFITQNIIKEQGGVLEVKTGPDGTHFFIYLPVSIFYETETKNQMSEGS